MYIKKQDTTVETGMAFISDVHMAKGPVGAGGIEQPTAHHDLDLNS